MEKKFPDEDETQLGEVDAMGEKIWMSGTISLTSYRFKLKSFQKFDSAAAAVEEAASIIEGKVTPRLSSLLDGIKDEKKASLAVADPKLGMSTPIRR